MTDGAVKDGENGAARAGARLALEFRADAFVLKRRRDEGGWVEAAVSALEAPVNPADFDAAIVVVLEKARELTGEREPQVEIWLPPERALLVKLGPKETAADALAAAPASASDLVHDLSRDRRLVAIAEYAVVEDALRYARGWGFAPTRVTARIGLKAFPEGPDFAEPAARPRAALAITERVAPLKRFLPQVAL
ncbi:MAG: hypothetical protein ACK5MQ_12680, partial [Pikeienuella sp.]